MSLLAVLAVGSGEEEEFESFDHFYREARS